VLRCRRRAILAQVPWAVRHPGCDRPVRDAGAHDAANNNLNDKPERRGGKLMKWLWMVLVFVIGGALGFFLGGAGGMMAGGIAGTEFGACVAVKVAEEKGLLSQSQAGTLLEETAAHLRTEFEELVEKAKLSEHMPLNTQTCEKLMAERKGQ
jgi:hypothetical protein